MWTRFNLKCDDYYEYNTIFSKRFFLAKNKLIDLLWCTTAMIYDKMWNRFKERCFEWRYGAPPKHTKSARSSGMGSAQVEIRLENSNVYLVEKN